MNGAAHIPALTGADRLNEARRISARRKRNTRLFLLLPGLIIIGLFGLMPLSITLVYSFLEPGSYGGVEWFFSLDAYVQFFVQRDIFDDTLSVNWSYISIFSRSVGLSFGATLGALILGFPTAYYIASKPGIVACCILVFIPGLGAYITPELLGGGKKLMIGNLIAIQFGSSRNWPFGSAAALILMAVVMLAPLLYVRQGAKGAASHG